MCENYVANVVNKIEKMAGMYWKNIYLQFQGYFKNAKYETRL